MPTDNLLFYGDNLDVLRRHIDDETVDLVYLDPPFKSEQNYNVLFAEQDGTRASAQIKAFENTWQWDQEAAAAYEQAVEAGGKVAEAMIGFRSYPRRHQHACVSRHDGRLGPPAGLSTLPGSR